MRIQRKSKKSDSSSKLVLEEIIGLTTKHANGLASKVSTGDCVYLAGCVVVVYNVESGTQSHFMVSSRMPKPLSCVAVSHREGGFIAAGESGHQPAVLVWDYSTRALLSELKVHQYGVACIAFSPDGKHLVSVGFPHDGNLCLWDWRNGRLVTKVKSSSFCSAISSVTFSLDANCFVTAGKKHLKFWTIGSSTTKFHSNVGSVFPTMDGKSANLGCQKGSSFISVVSATMIDPSLVGVDRASKFHPVYAFTDTGILCILNSELSITTWVDLKVEKGFALAISNKLIACACSNGVVQLFTIKTLKYAGRLRYSDTKEHHKASNISCDTETSEKGSESDPILPNAIACQFATPEKLVVVYGNHSLNVWDVRDVNKVIRCCVLDSHSACIWDVKNLSCDNNHDPSLACVARGCFGGVSFATCSADGTIRLWDLSLQPVFERKNSKPKVTIDEHIDGNPLDIEQVGAIHLVSAGIFERDIVESGVSSLGFRSMAVSSDGKYLAAGDCQGNLHVYNLYTSDYTCIQDAHDAEILSLAFSLPSKTNVDNEKDVLENHYLLASGGRDRMIHLYDVKRGFEVIESLDDHSAAVTSVKLTCNGCKILSCSADRSLVFRDVAITDNGCRISRRHHLIASHGTVYDMAIDPATEVAVTVGQDKKINTFNISAGRLVKTFKQDGDFGEPIKVSMDPSNSYLVCSYSNKSMCIYDFTSGELVTKAVGHGEVITGVVFLPDFKHIISVGGDGCIFVWKVPSPLSSKMLQRMKERVGPLSPTSMPKPVVSSKCLVNEEVGHLYDINSKDISMLGDLDQNGEKVPFHDVSSFRFSISRLPNWAQTKVTSKETVPAAPRITSSQQLKLEVPTSSMASNGGNSAPKSSSEVHTPCRQDLRDGELCPTNTSESSIDGVASRSALVSQDIPSFAMDKRWLTVHTVCLDLLDSPEGRNFKDVRVPVSDLKILEDSTLEGPSKCVDIGDPISTNQVFKEFFCGPDNQIADDRQCPMLNEKVGYSVAGNLCENEDQPSVHSTTTCCEASAKEINLEKSEILVQTTKDNEDNNASNQDDDLFSQHFSNLSTALKVECRRSSARRRYSARFSVRRGHLTGCTRLFGSPNRISGSKDLNSGDLVPHSSSGDPSTQVLEELRISDTCNPDVENSRECSPCTLRQSESSTSTLIDHPTNVEGIIKEKDQICIPVGTEMHEIITECKEALISLNGAAESTLQLFSKLGSLMVREEDISDGPRAEVYDQAAKLLSSVTVKLNALDDLVKSRNVGSCTNARVEDLSNFEPLLGRFAESLSCQVLELVKKNL